MIFGLTQLAYIVATSLFIFALHWMNTPQTARRGVYAGVVATVIAVAVTWAQPEIIHHWWIIGAIIAASIVFALLLETVKTLLFAVLRLA